MVSKADNKSISGYCCSSNILSLVLSELKLKSKLLKIELCEAKFLKNNQMCEFVSKKRVPLKYSKFKTF